MGPVLICVNPNLQGYNPVEAHRLTVAYNKRPTAARASVYGPCVNLCLSNRPSVKSSPQGYNPVEAHRLTVAYNNLGSLLKMQGQMVAAISCFEAVRGVRACVRACVCVYGACVCVCV